MKTMFSVCTLCLLLSVAGSYAQTISEGLEEETKPGSSSTVNNSPINDAAYDKAVRAVITALDYTFESISKGRSRSRIVGDLTFDVEALLADFIDETLEAGNELPPPDNCANGNTQIDVDSVSEQISQAVRQGFDQYQNELIKTASESFSRAVFDVSFNGLPVVNEKRCIREDLRTSTHLGFYGFEYYLLDTVDKLYLGLLRKDGDRARNCYDLDKLF